jgi:hypothetical protein
MFTIEHPAAGKKLHNPNMSNDRLREIGLELNRLIDAQNQVLRGRDKLGDMARQEVETYVQRNYRITLLCRELGEDWPNLRDGDRTARASSLVN